MARPTKYLPEFVEQAKKLCTLGATDIEIADFFGVNVATINRWKAEHKAFCASIKTGKAQSDERVERALFSRAIGYEHDEVDIRTVGSRLVKTPIRKFYPPDTAAAAFWLKNRQPDKWREMKAVELTGAGGGPVRNHITVEFVKAGGTGAVSPGLAAGLEGLLYPGRVYQCAECVQPLRNSGQRFAQRAFK